MEPHVLARKLDRATEELELKTALSVSIAQRQLQQTHPELPPRQASSQRKEEEKYVNLDSHKLVLQRRRKELIEGLSARPVADVMFQNGAMTLQDLETIQ